MDDAGRTRPSNLKANDLRESYLLDRRKRARMRLAGYLERTDPIGSAIYHFWHSAWSLTETIGALSDDEMVFVLEGLGSSAPPDHEFDAFFVDWADDTGVKDERIQELEDGAEPNEDELKVWRSLYATRSLPDLGEYFQIWRLSPRLGAPQYFVYIEGRSFNGLFRDLASCNVFLCGEYDAFEVTFENEDDWRRPFGRRPYDA